MIILYFVLTIVSGIIVNHCYKRAGNLKSGPVLFNFLFSFFCALGCGLLAGKTGKVISLQTAVFGIGTGTALAVAAVLYIRALACGPFVLSTALFTASSLLPVAYCAVYPGETLSGIQVIGYVLLIVCCFVLTQNGKSAGNTNHVPNVRWVALILLTVLINSLIPYGIRLQAQAVEGESVQMLFCYFATAATLNLVFACKKGSFQKGCIGCIREAVPTAVIMAVAICLNTWAQAQIGTHNIPAAIQYPVVNAGMLWLMAFTGRILYGERISWKNACALALCAVAGILTSL